MTSTETETTRTSSGQARAAPSSAGIWGLALAVAYAVLVRFYQAAGGTIGLGDSVPADPERMHMSSYLAGVLILAGGAACLVLTRPQLRDLGGRLSRGLADGLTAVVFGIPALLGGLFSVVHGLGGGSTHLLELLGLIDIRYPADAWERHDVQAMNWWTVTVYEPWFLAMGLALLFSVRAFASERVSPAVLRLGALVAAGVVAAGTAVTIWMVLTHRVVAYG